MRAGQGDRELAIRAIEAVLNNQIDDPSQPYHGTFQRSPEEAEAAATYARLSSEYDPNWRDSSGQPSS